MSDRIEPALTQKQWAQFREALASGSSLYDDTIGINAKECAEAIAYNNAALPDSDPRKITRRWVQSLREAAEQMPTIGAGPNGEDIPDPEFTAMAAALESYLPSRPSS